MSRNIYRETYNIRELSEMDAEDPFMKMARAHGLYKRIVNSDGTGNYAAGTVSQRFEMNRYDERHPDSGESLMEILNRKDEEAEQQIASKYLSRAPGAHKANCTSGTCKGECCDSGLQTVDPGVTWPLVNMEELEKELTSLFNRLSVDSALNMPDFYLARYVSAVVVALQFALKDTHSWKGEQERPADFQQGWREGAAWRREGIKEAYVKMMAEPDNPYWQKHFMQLLEGKS